MAIKTQVEIVCDGCGDSGIFENTKIRQAEKEIRSNAEWRVVEPGKQHFCEVCAWKHDHNYLAFDISLNRKEDFQVLAITHDPTCLERAVILFGPTEKKLSYVRVRRVDKPVYGTMKAFGIPEVPVERQRCIKKEEALFPNYPRFYTADEDEDDSSTNQHVHHFVESEWKSLPVINLSETIKEFLEGKIPHMDAPGKDTDNKKSSARDREFPDMPF